jgi:hypothetical protein
VRDASLSPSVKKDIVAAIAGQFTALPGEPDGRTIALGSWVSRLRLSETGPSAIVVHGGPDDYNNGATGNDDIWLFRQIGDHAVLIFSGGGFGLRPASKTRHHGLPDLQTAWNMSCCEGGIEVYRFDGHSYKPTYCFSYTTREDGTMTYGPRGRCDN